MKEYDKVCEKYMIKKVRSFYPHKLELSPEFLEAFKAEYARLVETGKNKRTLLERMRKALTFHL